MHTLLLCALSGASLPSAAEVKLDIISLAHRTPEQVLPALQPLVGAGAALSGANNRIFIRADAATREAVRQAIAALDTPLRSLLISVRQDNDDSLRHDDARASGEAGTDGVRARAQVWSTRGEAADRLAQRVRVVEGGAAFIAAGLSIPVPFTQMAAGPAGSLISQGVQYKDVSSGFYALARVQGDLVTVDVSPQKESLSEVQYGEIRSARLVSTVRGRLGEWMELGSSGHDEALRERGISRYRTRDLQSQRRVWVKVEVLRD